MGQPRAKNIKAIGSVQDPGQPPFDLWQQQQQHAASMQQAFQADAGGCTNV